MSVVGCGDLQLSAGRHDLRTDPSSGLDIDQLVLASETGGAAATIAPDGRPVLPAPGSSLPSVSRHNSSTSIDSTVRFTAAGEPAWLILRESLNAGWQATAEKGRDPSGPVLINGFANGWYLHTERAASDTFALRWTPQRTMDIALILSALGIVGALVLAVRGRRWSPESDAGRALVTDPLVPELDAPWSEWPPASRLRVGIIAATVGVVSALVIAPAWGVGVAALIAIAGRWNHGHTLLTGTALGGLAIAFAAVLTERASQRDVPPNVFFSDTITAHRLAMAAIALVAADVLLTAARRLGPTRDPFAHIHARTDDRPEPAPDPTTGAVGD